jgi:cobyrinic acid a,c-diamide synthase
MHQYPATTSASIGTAYCRMSHIFISAAHKSSGKTTISIGICAEFFRLGAKIVPFKKGPDYIDPLWLSQASRALCHNLDFFTQSHQEMRQSFIHASRTADLALIEGNKGLYDGMDVKGSNSNAALAILLDAPVILVIDAQGITRGVAPLLLGYQMFDKGVKIAGVILNKVGGARHERKLRETIAYYTDIPLVGAVHRAKELAITERHLGLIPSNESDKADEKIESIRRLVAEQVDFALLRKIAASAPLVGDSVVDARQQRQPYQKAIRIGIARDECFGFYYPGDLEAFTAAGAEVVFFSPVNDQALPEVDGLFIGGGFPEVGMEALQANAGMRHDIHAFIEDFGPVYAECGGLMYLSRSVAWKGQTCRMVGAIAGDAVMHERPQGRGYVVLRETEHFPWTSGTAAVEDICAHEFHYSRLENLAADQRFAYSVKRGTGVNGKQDGILYKNLLANYTHLRNVEKYRWVEKFCSYIRRCKKIH